MQHDNIRHALYVANRMPWGRWTRQAGHPSPARRRRRRWLTSSTGTWRWRWPTAHAAATSPTCKRPLPARSSPPPGRRSGSRTTHLFFFFFPLSDFCCPPLSYFYPLHMLQFKFWPPLTFYFLNAIKKGGRPADRRRDLCGEEAEQDAGWTQRRGCLARSRIQVVISSTIMSLEAKEHDNNKKTSFLCVKMVLRRYRHPLHLPGPSRRQQSGISRREREGAACGFATLAGSGTSPAMLSTFLLRLQSQHLVFLLLSFSVPRSRGTSRSLCILSHTTPRWAWTSVRFPAARRGPPLSHKHNAKTTQKPGTRKSAQMM